MRTLSVWKQLPQVAVPTKLVRCSATRPLAKGTNSVRYITTTNPLPWRELGIKQECISHRMPFSNYVRMVVESPQRANGSVKEVGHAGNIGVSHIEQFPHAAFIALGSNLGDRFAEIELACRKMDETGEIRIIRTSGLWETVAMYVTNQNRFLNGVCEVRTSLEPMQLLDRLQGIENEMGRKKVIDKGPRNIDLDILLYNNEVLQHERLQIPHKLMLEREFVLRPLAQLIPNHTLPAPHSQISISSHLSSLPIASPISTLTPLNASSSITALSPTRSTHLMSILNLTPDSFSDGGQHNPNDSESLSATIKSHIASGATILDIGGQSTRPGATPISAEEELARVLPAIRLIRNMPEGANVAISVDTYRAAVAREAVQAGADIVNDVSAGTMDPDMLGTVAELGCTVCLMHMRGTPETMTRPENTSYPAGVVETVAEELRERVAAAEKAGVKRWRMILDPGIGFAKGEKENLVLLRDLGNLRAAKGLDGIPWLVGSSRKGFVGRITGVKEPKERVWGTAATVSGAVAGGADVVRVHDVREMVAVVKMSDAIWRR